MHGVWKRLLLLVIVLFVSIGLHESGHFAAYRLFNTGIDRFQVGLGPELIHREGATTDFVVGAIPLGGFVKAVSSETKPSSEERALLSESRPERLAMLLDHEHSIERLSHAQKLLALFAGPVAHAVIAWGALCLLWRTSNGGMPGIGVLAGKLPLLILRLLAREVGNVITLGRVGYAPERDKELFLSAGITSTLRDPGWVGFLHMVAFTNWALLALNLFVPVAPLDGGKIVLELIQLCFGKIPEHVLVWVHTIGFCVFIILIAFSGFLRKQPATSR